MALTRGKLKAQVRKLKTPSPTHIEEVFSPWVNLPKNFGRPARSRLFFPSRIFWLFLAQVLTKAQSCRETLQTFLAWLACEQGATASPNTAAYCKARKRLSIREILNTHGRIVEKMEATAGAERLWCGRSVRIVDGSSVSMPDTQKNQKLYPQPSRQKKGCGFPIMRITALFSLASGAMIAVAKSSLHVSERELFRELWRHLKTLDVVLADRGFCGFAEFYLLLQRGVDCVMRNHPRRTKGLTEIKRLGKDDRIIEWHKMKPHPRWFSKKRWAALPERLLVREIRVHVEIKGFRTRNLILVTTLLDPKAFPKEAFALLYRKRWNAELYLRDIKTTMGMNILRCKTPEMVEKELAMHVIAYNLIRALMIESAQTHHIPYERLSFKGSISIVRQWAPTLAQPTLSPSKLSALYAKMLFYIAKDQLPYRPNRVEPRAIKRRPTGYQFLMKPRHVFKEIPHRRKYKKA